jgi:hypothetical protein
LLKWCRANQCPWDKTTCRQAAFNGHLELLKWARLNGCPWDEVTYKYAVENRDPALVRYLKDEGCPMYDSDDLDDYSEYWFIHILNFAIKH